jgi:hypothetical protein
MIGSLLKLLGIYSSNSSVSKVPKLNTKVEENSNTFNITDRLSNQADDIKLWYIKPEDSPELEESDIPGVYFNEFREMYYLHRRSMQYGIKTITRMIIIDNKK